MKLTLGWLREHLDTDADIKVMESTLTNIGLEVESIKDVTPIPHNGCRPRKRRRV